ncbi:hypothetical protein AB0M91_14285 [Micromonospora rifamycinica]|uniref:hypothetical protein n=1 Tax=Micromonospora rifamycinica TaxID=291594 RepID=UPI003437D48A
MELVDTQIVSYAWKGVAGYEINGKAVSSVVAQEFLLIQEDNPRRPRYYLPRLQQSEVTARWEFYKAGDDEHVARLKRPSHGWRKRTERLMIDLGEDFPAIVEYGHGRLSAAINDGDVRYFELCIAALDRRLRRKLMDRFSFMVECRLKCVALSLETVSRMFPLLDSFSATYNMKADYRNTINDMLILATALERNSRLLTMDSLLNRFAANYYGVTFDVAGSGVGCLEFGGSVPCGRKSRESRGYINRGWRVHESRG